MVPDVVMWYLDKNNEAMGPLCDLVSNAYKTCRRYLVVAVVGKRTENIEIFVGFGSKNKI